MIEFNNISKQYTNTFALKNLSFIVEQFEFVSLIGNNGSGKSTAINILANLIGYSGGNLKIKGKEIVSNNHSYKRNIGFVFDEPIFIEEFNTLEYLNFVAKFQGINGNDAIKRINELLQLLGLEKDKNKPICKLSSGNQMKVSICSALIHNPEILVFDEPFIHLDIQTIDTVMKLLKSFKEKKTLFITSHNLDLTSELTDRFLILDNGKIIADLRKSDFEDIESLKFKTIKYLTKENQKFDLNWLK